MSQYCNVTEEDVLSLYCRISVSIMNAGHDILASTFVAKHFHITLYRARKLIKSLVTQGLLISNTDSGYDDYNYMPYCYHGYCLTSKAEKTKTYKKAQWQEAKICSKVWGGGSPYDYFKSWRNPEQFSLK